MGLLATYRTQTEIAESLVDAMEEHADYYRGLNGIYAHAHVARYEELRDASQRVVDGTRDLSYLLCYVDQYRESANINAAKNTTEGNAEAAAMRAAGGNFQSYLCLLLSRLAR